MVPDRPGPGPPVPGPGALRHPAHPTAGVVLCLRSRGGPAGSGPAPWAPCSWTASGWTTYPLGVAAAGAILRYLKDSHTPELPHLDRLLALRRDDYLGLDEATLRHLEIFETWRSRSRQGSLAGNPGPHRHPHGGPAPGPAGCVIPCRIWRRIEARLDGGGVFQGQRPPAPALAPDPERPGGPGAPHRPGGPGAGHPPGGGGREAGPGPGAPPAGLIARRTPGPGGRRWPATWTACPNFRT